MKIQDPKLVFKEYCKRQGMRYTPERDLIIEEVYRKDGHFDVDNLFLRIRNRFPKTKLAKGSIYRAVPHLIRTGLIRESLTDAGDVFYEHTLGHSHHDHMKCLKCGKIFEFYEPSIDKIQQEICKRRKFKMIRHTHVIAGYCKNCYTKKKEVK
ncbi:MAG: Fur family transcriptional regulator [Candidatus Omnitrophota bacterium]